MRPLFDGVATHLLRFNARPVDSSDDQHAFADSRDEEDCWNYAGSAGQKSPRLTFEYAIRWIRRNEPEKAFLTVRVRQQLPVEEEVAQSHLFERHTVPNPDVMCVFSTPDIPENAVETSGPALL